MKFSKLICFFPNNFLSFFFSCRAKGFLKNIVVQNLNQFTINDINFNVLTMRIDFSISFPEISATGKYSINASIAGLTTVEGDGPFDVTVKSLF